MTTREPEYRPSDRAELLAYMDYVADLGPHGIPMSEAMDPANEHGFAAANGGIPTVDFAEKAILDAKDAYYKAWPDESGNGHRFGVVRLPPLQQEPDRPVVGGPGDV